MGIWDSVLLTLVGGVVAASAGLLGSAFQARQTTRARREQHEREDQYRLHQDRVTAYIAFQDAVSRARRTIQNLVGDTEAEHAECRAARNEAHLAYVRVMLLGGSEVVAAARQTMIYLDGIVYRGEAFDASEWSAVNGWYQNAARHELTGQRDLPEIVAATDWPAPPPSPTGRT